MEQVVSWGDPTRASSRQAQAGLTKSSATASSPITEATSCRKARGGDGRSVLLDFLGLDGAPLLGLTCARIRVVSWVERGGQELRDGGPGQRARNVGD